jgi:hypothetical protein
MKLISKEKLAPVIIFVYDRYYHTKKTLDALQNNFLAEKTNVIIYSDCYKKKNKKKVLKVRNLIKKYKKFKSIKVIKRKNNFGLANSIKSGINQTFKKYNEAIFLEDDIVSNKYFLYFMNSCLIKYKKNKKIFHISSWNYPMINYGLSDINFSKVMNCWGWATWKNRWNKVSFNNEEILKNFSTSQIKQLNIDGFENFWFTFLLNYKKKIRTWAIYWAISIIRNNALCVIPKNSYSKNIGMDGTGENNSKKFFINPYLFERKKTITDRLDFPQKVLESKIHRNYIKLFYFLANSKVLTLINRLYLMLTSISNISRIK